MADVGANGTRPEERRFSRGQTLGFLLGMLALVLPFCGGAAIAWMYTMSDATQRHLSNLGLAVPIMATPGVLSILGLLLSIRALIVLGRLCIPTNSAMTRDEIGGRGLALLGLIVAALVSGYWLVFIVPEIRVRL